MITGDEVYPDEEYYLANTQGGCATGNSLKWWAIEDHGYTCDVRYAKVWKGSDDKMKSLRMCDIPFLKSEIDKLVQHHIDIQDLRRNQAGKRPMAAHTTLLYKQLLKFNADE